MKGTVYCALALAIAAGHVPAYAGGGPGPTLPYRYVASRATGADWTMLQDRSRGFNDVGQQIWNRPVNGQMRAGISEPDGSWTALDQLYGTTECGANDLNNYGVVVGMSIYPSGPLGHATLWDPKAGPVDIGPVGPDFYSQTNSINDYGDVAVNVRGGPLGPGNLWGGLYHAGTLFRLDDYIDTPGVQFENTGNINNAGYILGNGRIDGRFMGIKLTPVAVPEPGTIGLVSLGFLTLPGMLRKKR